MAQVQVYNQEGRKTSKLELADSVFGIEPNGYAMHLAVVSYLSLHSARARSQLSLVLRFQAAAQNPGGKRAQAVLVRAPQEARSGHTAVLLSAPSQENTL